jgi:fatty-acyl-CoA synthase
LHPDDLIPLLESEKVTLSMGVPTIWLPMVQILDKNRGRWKLQPNLRLTVGGSAVPEAMIRAYAKLGIEVIQGWGMTETSPLATISKVTALHEPLSEDERFAVLANQGYPLPLVDIRAIGDQGEQPWDGKSVGEIQVHGPWITGSYYNQPAPENFAPDGWLRTGDVASLDPVGVVKITDRTKDLIKSGGEWISSVDLENAIMGHPAVQGGRRHRRAPEVGRAATGGDRAQAGRHHRADIKGYLAQGFVSGWCPMRTPSWTRSRAPPPESS